MTRVQSRSRPSPGLAATPPVNPETGGEIDYQRCLSEIAAKKRRIADAEAELGRLRRALERFELLCQARVGDLLTDLRQVGETIARYRSQLDQLRAAVEPPPPDRDAPPFSGGDGWDPEPNGTEPGPDPDLGLDDGGGAGDDAAEAKRLYRELAKRCHPDFARDDAERGRREARMLQVNEAFRRRDLDALRTLRHEIEADDPDFARRPLSERLAWALTELQRLDAVLAELRSEWMRLRRGDLHKLWKRHEAGEPVFDDLRDDLEAQLAAEADRLDHIIAAYRALADDHPGAVAAR